MKKLLTGLLALLTCFTVSMAVACGENDKPDNSGNNNSATTDLEGAKEFLYGMYADQYAEVRTDYEVVNTVFYDGVSYTVSWTVSGSDSISLKPGSSDAMTRVDVDETTTEAISYTLTATISDASGKTITLTFDRMVTALVGDSIMAPQENVAYNMYIEQISLGKNLLLTGKMDSQNKYLATTTNNAEAANVYAEVADGGYKFYFLGENDAKSYITLTERYREDKSRWAADLSLGDTGSVFYFDGVGVWACKLDNDTYFLGTYGSYETTSASTSYYMKAENIGVSQYPLLIALPNTIQGGQIEGTPVVQEPAADSALTITEAIDLANELKRDTQNKYYITGTITEIYNETYGNMYIADEAGNTIQVYGTYDADGKNRFDAMTTKPVVGDTVKLYSIVSYFNNPQLKNAWIVEINGESGGNGGTENPPVVTPSGDYLADKVITNPAADTAYNLYMYQATAEKLVYLSGGMDGYYLATSENASDAVVVKLETTEGGFYLYYLDGETKTYINIVTEMGTDGKEHTNAKLEATASSVYTFNTEYNTLVADGNFLGTRSDKSYLTVGPCAEKYLDSNFMVKFVAVDGENGGNGGTEEPPVVTPSGDYLADKVVTNPAVDTAYNLYMYQATAEKLVYLAGGMDGYYLASSENASDAVVVKLETTEGGFYLYYLDGETKNYINIVTETGTDGKEHTNAKIETTASSVYTFNTEYNTLVGNGYFLGTRNDKTYLTVGPCAEKYLDSNFMVKFVAVDGEGGGSGSDTEEPPVVTPPVVDEIQTLTITEALAIGAGKAHNEYTSEKYYVFGTIVEVYNAEYGNMYIEDAEGNRITVYGSYSADGSVEYKNMENAPVAGDYVKLLSIVGQYNSTPQLKNAWIIEVTPASDETKATLEKEALTLIHSCTGERTVELATAGTIHTNVAIAWEVVAGNEVASISEGNLVITNPAEGTVTVTVKATLTCGEATVIKEFAIEVSHKAEGDPVAVEATLSFADKANRTSYSTSQQVWEQNGVKLTNDKGASTSNVGDYANPARFYKSSTVTIECNRMTQIVFNVAGLESKYVDALKGSLGVEYTVEGNNIIVTFENEENSFSFVCSAGQARAMSITVTYNS